MCRRSPLRTTGRARPTSSSDVPRCELRNVTALGKLKWQLSSGRHCDFPPPSRSLVPRAAEGKLSWASPSSYLKFRAVAHPNISYRAARILRPFAATNPPSRQPTTADCCCTSTQTASVCNWFEAFQDRSALLSLTRFHLVTLISTAPRNPATGIAQGTTAI